MQGAFMQEPYAIAAAVVSRSVAVRRFEDAIGRKEPVPVATAAVRCSVASSTGGIMTFRSIVVLVAGFVLGTPALAQHGPANPPSRVAPHEATQFDFLIGQWEIVAMPHVPGLAARIHGSPKLQGTWKAWRGLDGWGIDDELRLTDASGNPMLLAHAMRAYDGTARHWIVATLDVYRATLVSSTAQWSNGAMHFEGAGTDSEGRPYRSRGRFLEIEPEAFTYRVDRSYDDGKTWTEDFLRIDAKRVAAVAPR
jgi:hypothetical protein